MTHAASTENLCMRSKAYDALQVPFLICHVDIAIASDWHCFEFDLNTRMSKGISRRFAATRCEFAARLCHGSGGGRMKRSLHA